MQKNKSLLLIFGRYPSAGKVKTRLAQKIGPEAALEVYLLLLQHTEEQTSPLSCDKWVYFSEKIPEAYFQGPGFKRKLQQEGDLGQKMEHAFNEGFDAGYSRIIIIGTDLLEISTIDLEAALDYLDKQDYVIGPAVDGGYYLLGSTRKNPHIFRNKSWGTASVLPDTLADLKSEKVGLLPPKNDIDVYEDLIGIPEFQEYLKVR